MYSSKMQNTILVKNNFCTISENKLKERFHLYYTIMVRHTSSNNPYTINYFKNVQERIATFLKNDRFYNHIRNKAKSIPQHLKEHSSKILRTWVHQCECVLAQRLRRSQQMFSLYSKLWEEQALREFLKRMRLQLTRHSKELLLGAVGINCYNWEKNRIPESEILIHSKEFEYIEKLRRNTMKCSLCDIAPRNSKKICHCPDKAKFKFEEWELFVEKDDLLIWRKLHPNGCYEYKVYGSYNDILAEDFINVQIDINYRKTWDSSAVVLELIEKDPTPASNSDLVYWEMQWPRMFTNRDYVFNRRFLVDHKSRTIIIANRITEHPAFPIKSDKYRVTDYWSNMVVKPYCDYNKPGLEFALTYFENSGLNIPSTVTSWVAMKALPEYLTKLREATRGYDSFCKEVGRKCLCKFLYEDCNKVILIRNDDMEDITYINNEIHNFIGNGDDGTRSPPPSPSPPPKTPREREDKFNTITSQHVQSTPVELSNTNQTAQNNQNEYKNSYWKYLQPAYYFS